MGHADQQAAGYRDLGAEALVAGRVQVADPDRGRQVPGRVECQHLLGLSGGSIRHHDRIGREDRELVAGCRPGTGVLHSCLPVAGSRAITSKLRPQAASTTTDCWAPASVWSLQRGGVSAVQRGAPVSWLYPSTAPAVTARAVPPPLATKPVPWSPFQPTGTRFDHSCLPVPSSTARTWPHAPPAVP